MQDFYEQFSSNPRFLSIISTRYSEKLKVQHFWCFLPFFNCKINHDNHIYIRIAIPPLYLKLVVVGFSPVGRDICYQTYFNSGDFWLEFLLSLYIFEGSVFTFQFLNDKIHDYVFLTFTHFFTVGKGIQTFCLKHKKCFYFLCAGLLNDKCFQR